MWTSTARLAIALVVSVPLAAAIRNTEGSHCTKWCGNNQAVTADDEIFCTEPSLQTSGGGLWENCVKCQLTSPYVNGNDSDLGALLYNLRRALDKCLFEPGTQCATSTACGPLKNAIEYRNNITTGIGLYDFCPQWAANVALEHCSPCVRVLPMNTDGGKYIDNFVHILEAACEQKPEPGSTISVSGDPFSEDSPVVIVPPQTTHASVPMPDYGPISLGARVGIAFGVLALILAVVGYCIVCNGKRRRRAFLRQLERRHGANQGWPHPSTRYGGNGGGAGGDMFETPISQKALRGWENESPISAITENTERTFPRYFSPYSSQFNSPVSAPGTSASATANWPSLSPLQPNTQRLEQLIQTQSPVHGSPPPAFTQWPSPRHEQTIMQTQTLQEKRQQEIAIGLALGGDEASLRSKTSNGAMKADSPYGYPTDTKGKGRAEEAYELREVPSPFSNNGGEVSNNPYYQMPTPPEAPVLRHPGHGRMPGGSRPGSNEGGVTGLGLHTVPISQ